MSVENFFLIIRLSEGWVLNQIENNAESFETQSLIVFMPIIFIDFFWFWAQLASAPVSLAFWPLAKY